MFPNPVTVNRSMLSAGALAIEMGIEQKQR